MQNDADDLNAVRINIPLSRVESVEKTQLPAFAGLFSFTFDPTSSNGAPNGVLSASTSEEVSILDTPPVKQVLQLGILREDTLWKNIMAYVKTRRKPQHQRAMSIGQDPEFSSIWTHGQLEATALKRLTVISAT